MIPLSHRLCLLTVGLGLWALPGAAFAEGAPSNAEKTPPPSAFLAPESDRLSGESDFTLLPKAFQKNPVLDMTCFTEITPFGRSLRSATPEKPVYYVTHSAGYKQLGWSVANEHATEQTVMERVMTKALATNGFLREIRPDHPATLAVIYSWGSHNSPDAETIKHFPELAIKAILERSTLVGGKKFHEKLSAAMETGIGPGEFGEQAEFLLYQAHEELYYVVASAYDYAALARGQRRLAWRTTMTVNSLGVAMKESLPTLISNSAPFFGRETTQPQIAMQRISREGHVDIGELKVVPEKPAAAPPELVAPKKP